MIEGVFAMKGKNNFQGYGIIKNIVFSRTPRYGNDDDYADDIMNRVFKMVLQDEIIERIEQTF